MAKKVTTTHYHGIWETQNAALEIHLKSEQTGKAPPYPIVDATLWRKDVPTKLFTTLADCLEDVKDPELTAKDLNKFLPVWLDLARNYAFSLPITRPVKLVIGNKVFTINEEQLIISQDRKEVAIPYYLVDPILAIKKPRKLHKLPKELGNHEVKVAYDGNNYYLRTDNLAMLDRSTLLKVRRELVKPFENLQERIFWIEETDMVNYWITALQQP